MADIVPEINMQPVVPTKGESEITTIITANNRPKLNDKNGSGIVHNPFDLDPKRPLTDRYTFSTQPQTTYIHLLHYDQQTHLIRTKLH